MSALTILLGPPADPESARLPRTLLFPEGEQLHLQEDESSEEVIIFSMPGKLTDLEWLAGQEEPWKWILAHPRYDGVRCSLAVDSQSGQVYLADVWPRAMLDTSALESFLADHLSRHRAWRETLALEEGELFDLANAAGELSKPHLFT